MEAPPGGNQDRGPQAVAIFWAEAAIAIVVVALRIWGRLMIHQLGPDDYVMIFTLVIFIILSGFVTYYASINGLRHLYYLQPEQQAQAVKYNWITQPWAIFGFATGKISVALLILRLIGPNTVWRKWILYVAMVSVLIFNSVDCILTFVQCNPPRALWMPQLIASGEAKCWDSRVQADFAIFLAAWNIMIDVVLAVLPVTIFYGLALGFRRKLGLSVLLGLGLIAAICGIIKTKFLAALNARSDLTWETYNLFVWSGAELFVIIVCGSVPPIKPLYDHIFGKKRHEKSGYSQPRSDDSYALNKSLRSKRSGKAPDSRDGHLTAGSISSDEELGINERGNNERKGAGVQGIMRVTDVRVTHVPRS